MEQTQNGSYKLTLEPFSFFSRGEANYPSVLEWGVPSPRPKKGDLQVLHTFLGRHVESM